MSGKNRRLGLGRRVAGPPGVLRAPRIHPRPGCVGRVWGVDQAVVTSCLRPPGGRLRPHSREVRGCPPWPPARSPTSDLSPRLRSPARAPHSAAAGPGEGQRGGGGGRNVCGEGRGLPERGRKWGAAGEPEQAEDRETRPVPGGAEERKARSRAPDREPETESGARLRAEGGRRKEAPKSGPPARTSPPSPAPAWGGCCSPVPGDT